MSSLSTNALFARTVRATFVLSLVAIPLLGAARARHRNPAQGSVTAQTDDPASLHMIMTPARPAVAGDSARAAAIAQTLRSAIAKYRDTSAAVADGYKLFAPEIKTQKIYHFSNDWLGLKEAFRFDPAKPTSILYRKDASGNFVLVGAMYHTPARFTLEQLDARVPLSIARWHQHTNWCLPPRGQRARWLERRDGQPVFGPESPIATKDACDAVHGVFHEKVFGWMLHANVFEGDDPKTIWADDHAGHDMHDGMKMDGSGE